MRPVAHGQKNPVEVHAVAAPAPPESAEPGGWNGYFEDLYRDAAGDCSRIPWADERPNPAMVAWLNREAPGMIRPGASVVVVGCGLGDDVQELAERGYDPVAFDVSPTAVQWARRRHPALADRFLIADLFHPPTTMLHRADLVVEINTIQALHPSLRGSAANAIVNLARPRGYVLIICRGCEPGETSPAHPPFPLSPVELTGLFQETGWSPVRAVDDFEDDDIPPQRRLRVVLRRG